MKKYLLLLSVIALFTSCKEDEMQVDLQTSASFTLDIKITNKEEILKGNVLPGDTVTLSFNLKATSLGAGVIDTLRIWTEVDKRDLNEKDTVEIDDVVALFNKTIPINRSFEKELDTIINLQVILPEFTVKKISSGPPYINIETSLAYSDEEGRYEGGRTLGLPGISGLNLLSTENTEYTFKLYNNYVGKPFDDPSGLGFNLYTQQYLNTPCVLDDACFPGTHYEDSRFLELPTIYNMSYLPEANPEEKFFVPAFGNLYGFGITDGLTKRYNYNFERRFSYDNPDRENVSYYNIAPSVEVGDIFSIWHVFIRSNGGDSPTIYMRVLDIVEGAEDSYVEFEVFIDYRSMYIFNEYHGI